MVTGKQCVLIYCVVLWINLGYDSAVEGACQERQDPLPTGRECRKACQHNRECRSNKKKCQCDGICGMSCIKLNQECKPLANIPHGRVDIKPNNRFGAIAQYYCEDGYKLRGDQARVCQGDETWSGSIPQCFVDHNMEKVECSSPPSIYNAVHDGSPDQRKFKLGTMLQYKCEPEFTLNSDAVVRAWCVGGGITGWVGPNMTCTRKDAGCPRLEDIHNGWVEQSPSNIVGSVAIYHCKRKFYLAGREERKCLSGGKWEGVPPSCEAVTCNDPPKIEHAEHNGDSQPLYPSGQQLMYKCSYGYYADGEPRAMCSGEGKWIGLTLLCSPRSCGFPGDIDNGWRTGYAFTFPNVVKYFCHDGFELVGQGNRSCQADGRWSGIKPICEPVTCPNLFAPVYGHMYGDGTGYGTVIRFQCDDGYKNIGASERRCQSDRTWSGAAAKCEGYKEINCGWPGPFFNGYLIGHKTTVGSTIFFSCVARTTFEGDTFQTQCLETGEWSNKPPICWGQCQVPAIPNATLLGGSELKYENHGVEVRFQCKGGLVPRDSSSMTCNNGTWSSSAECVPAPCHSAPPHVHNGMRIYMGQEHGFRAKYKCFAGFRLTGMNGTYLTCEFGSWHGGRPHCEEFYCPNPGTISHGKVYKKSMERRFDFKPYIRSIRHGYRLEFDCDVGYRITGPGGATCVNGQWQPPLNSTKCELAIHPPFRKLWTPIPNIYTHK
ncbi:protein lev-9-like isoform X1 [Ruditapes philippinarum]|uniref:protein lev-9-like isoform X1 n=1 Tax=Ruditapes philippinarum TaxID=129788 RepID=UPI00295AA8BC|nr:protein lev-9-like isoform X1 [Ruditapes philippinarum]